MQTGDPAVNTTKTGKEAEERVARILIEAGHKISAMNWRTRWCEIDIVSTHDNRVYFTEVKYRSSSEWGSGFDYVGPKKLKQMHFAAEFWLHENNWRGESVLQAAEVASDGSIEIIEIF